ncbi:TPA: ABC transporter substrate-binding protein, partial [bacterium]|nr:ABC transporter substrate-binding protein [bacterium]
MGKSLRVFVSILLTVFLLVGLIEISLAQEKIPEIKVYNSPAEYEKATKKKIARFAEAPMLTDLVKEGKLPSVDKRLPQEPLVVTPVEE